MSCELVFEEQLMSALPQWPTSPSSRYADKMKMGHFRCAKVTNLNQDLTAIAPHQWRAAGSEWPALRDDQ